MGSGDFGSNGSVHWRVIHTADEPNGGYIWGRDPNVRSKAPEEGHVEPKVFDLRLRFRDDKAAIEALNAALKTVTSKGDVLIAVPAIRKSAADVKTAVQKDSWTKLPWEIRIHW